MRKNAISIELNDKAKEVYKGLPKEVKKGEWVSDAIVEKHSKDTGTDLSAQVQDLQERVEMLEGGKKG